jgi:Protein of unknown function (DUF1236)
MTRSALLASTAVALVLGLAPANAQMQQERGQQDKGATERSQTQDQKGQSGASDKSTEPKDKAPKGSAQRDTEPKDKSTKGTAEGNDRNDKARKSAADRPESRDKGAADRPSEPKDRKGSADKGGEPKDKATKGTAERETPSRDKAARDKAAPDKAAGTERSGSSQRVQLTDEKRTNVNQTILRDRNVNRINTVNFSINVGTRVPRSVRLVALPTSVIEIVPEYRSYRYFVVDDQICIVEPSTYEIVEVIRVSDRTAGRDSRAGGGAAALMLTEKEKEILLREVDLRSDSTLALGALTEGAEVPRDVSLRTFSAAVVEQVPKVRDYKYVTAEHRLAIVDPRGSKVELVIEDRR